MTFLAEAATAAATNLNVFDFSRLASPEAWISLLTLAVLEIVLGIDNIVFISILVEKLPPEQRPRGRFLAPCALPWAPVHPPADVHRLGDDADPASVHGLFGYRAFARKDLALILGGLFLIYRMPHEIHAKLEGDAEGEVRDMRDEGLLRRRAGADRHSRHRVLAGLRHHRRGHAAQHISIMVLAGDDRRRVHHAVRRSRQRLRRPGVPR